MQSLKEIFQATYRIKKLEDAISALKQVGASQIESIQILMTELKMSLQEADNIILNSQAWKQHKTSTDILRENIHKTFDETNGID